jgi:hypothetical protein
MMGSQQRASHRWRVPNASPYDPSKPLVFLAFFFRQTNQMQAPTDSCASHIYFAMWEITLEPGIMRVD